MKKLAHQNCIRDCSHRVPRGDGNIPCSRKMASVGHSGNCALSSGLLTITVDPSFTGVAILLAPLNALLYGLVGILIGLAVEEVASERTK